MLNQRYEELDSLRGLAALSVFFLHIYSMFPGNAISKIIFQYSPLSIFFSGSQAVVLFFVLSGFVLALPFYNNKQPKYHKYLIRRFCRIYLPYIFIIFLSIICRELFYNGTITTLSTWFDSWSKPVNVNVILDHLILVDTFSSGLNNVVWSLIHEMRISIIFPFIMYLLIRMSWMSGVSLSLGMSILSIILSSLLESPSIGTELIYSIHFTSMFIIGAVMAKHRNLLMVKVSTLNRKIKWLIFTFGVLAYLYPKGSFIIKHLLFDNIPGFYRNVIDNLTVTVGSCIFIILTISLRSFSLLLKNKMVNYLGKISFSLYLSHLIVLYSCVNILYGIMPIWLICIISVIITLITSSILYHFVEKPAIRLGKLLTKPILIRRVDQTNTNTQI